MNYQFSELTSDEMQSVLEAFDGMKGAAALLIERHVIKSDDTATLSEISDAIMDELTRRAHVDAGRRVPARRREQ